MNNFYTAILASIIGGLITGGFMMWENRNNHKHDLSRINDEEKRQENAVLQAIKTEIEAIQVVFNNYEKYIDVLVKIKPEDFHLTNETIPDGFEMLISYFNNNFYDIPEPIVYYNNCSFIGNIKDENLRGLIIGFYINLEYFRKLITSYKTNQEMADKILYDYNEKRIHGDKILYDELYLITIDEILNNFSLSIKIIKDNYNNLKKYFKNIINHFNCYSSKN